MSEFDTIIVGAGIAGSSAALHLSQSERVLLIEGKRPAAGASGVAGGLFSPMIALRGRPVWQIDDAIAAFHTQLEMAGVQDLFDRRGVLRPAKDEQQVGFFKQSVGMCPQHAAWWPAEKVATHYPVIKAPLGALFAKTGGAFSTTLFTQKMVAAAINGGATYIENKWAIGWQESESKVHLQIASSTKEGSPTEDITANRIIFAIGDAFFDMAQFADLDLHAVKGQTIRIQKPALIQDAVIPPTSSQAYIIPEGDMLSIGSTFEHTFEHKHANRDLSLSLLEKVTRIIPELAGQEILEEHVGIRVTVPVIRLPMVGPLPNSERVWVFTGFGSKGLLLAPLLASRLQDYFKQPGEIPPEIRVRIKS